MGATDRIVKHLRLRADSEARVRRTLLSLEDALRCASLPDDHARVLLVRKLDLGRIAPDASTQMLSHLLEQRIAAGAMFCVHGTADGAAQADAVYFDDALQARYALALRLAQAAPCTAWYWPLAVPEYKPALDAHANLRHIALAMAGLPEAPAALPAWIARLTAAGVAPALAQAIDATTAGVLLRAASLSAATSHAAATHETGAAVGGSDAAVQRHADPAFSALPPWMQTLARAGGYATRDTAAATRVSMAAAERAAPRPTVAASESQQAETVHARDHYRSRQAPAADAAAATAPPWRQKPERVTRDNAMRTNLAGAPMVHAATSAYGGLLFLLPLLQRLGYPVWAESLPAGCAAQVVRQLLAQVLRHLRAPHDDSAWHLAHGTLENTSDAIHVIAPAGWVDPLLAPPRPAAGNDLMTLMQAAQTTPAVARGWHIACRRWLRRQAGIGVASLVTRPATLAMTATHADVYFRLNSVDMRVRRAGLDVDPGWVPWYGRVVRFHYGEQPTVSHQRFIEGPDDGG